MSETDLHPRLTAARPDLADSRLRGIVTADRYVDGTVRRVVDGSAPLRRDPRPDSSLDTELLHGETVRVFEETAEGWAWVKADRDGYVGWCPAAAFGPPRCGADPPGARFENLRLSRSRDQTAAPRHAVDEFTGRGVLDRR